MKLGDKNIIAAYLGDVNVFTNYYGVSFPIEPQDTLMTRTGYMPWHKELPVQSKMRTCTITSDGTVKYLSKTDYTKYEDGTDRNMNLNTMVEIPEFWYKCMKDDTTVYLNIYPANPHIPEVEHVEKFYISAYEATQLDDNILRSINNGSAVPVVNISRAVMQTRARANKSDATNWNIYTYKAHRALCVLYFVEYACTNSQKAFNAELTADGYHQGGLGVGITKGTMKVNGNLVYSFVPCGITDSLNGATGQVSYSYVNIDAEGNETSATQYANSYRGIENPFGHVWKNTIDTLVHYNEQIQNNDVYVTSDLTKYGSSTISDYLLQCSTTTTEGYKKRMIYNPAFDLLPPVGETFDANSSTYWCDYNYSNNSTSDRTILLGGRSDYGSNAGLVDCRSSDGLGGAGGGVGTRLIYIP